MKSILVAVHFSDTMARAVECAVSQGLESELRMQGLDVDAVLVRGTAVRSILEEARVRDVELIVLGSHGRGAFYRAIVGSVGEGVLRGSQRPVLIVPSPRATD